MIRRISTKLILAVLVAVVLPFVAFAFYINEQMSDRLTRHVVQQALLGFAKDLAGQIDYFIEERYRDLELLTPATDDALDDYEVERRLMVAPPESADDPSGLAVWGAGPLTRWSRGEASTANLTEFKHRSDLTRSFDLFLEVKTVYDLLLLIGADGGLVTCSSRHPEGFNLPEEYIAFLFEQDYSREPWFQDALQKQFVQVNHHQSPYRLSAAGDSSELAWEYQLGFAAPVTDPRNPDEVRGVVYALVNWNFIQEIVSNDVVKDAFRGLVEEDPSVYAWIWAEDADTILGHPDRMLYGKSISRDVRLPQLTRAVLADEDGYGLFPEYEFRGELKNAAFKRCRSPEEGGFDWVVGVGIDNDDIFATAGELRSLLMGGTAIVLVLAVIFTLLIARKTTGPILELQRMARRVSEGDLDAHIEITSRDELGALAEDFNRMTSELKDQRERIVKAEKDAAWREMARQIAHDIKNPLTPIKLSLDLLERARREHADGSEEILERTMELIRRQVENLQQIAGDFHEFTGGQNPNPTEIDLGELLDEVLHLHDAWAVELGVDVQREGPDARVYADLGKLRRVFVNLLSNAMQAMPEGGELFVETVVTGGDVCVSFRDTGEGIPDEAREHLFEPYFTTKSEGTGLGLAISKQVIEQMGGTIELVSVRAGRGSLATVRLPLMEESAGPLGEGTR